ncbi:DNA-binding domain-containing protein [Xanthomonas cassavae CFBP 4642]|uniref:DNA-binding domain-containing protein n=1 Tax=Xanthomonas cassavae CFBP 4642 TaxID=1219375 RepID=A0ABS8HH79_9XANT|nr:DNA-binding domain-containing protein [Xanthomonas cassavae]MCC4621526.1 DNA-binding domain-containing protein [Xanthomonas cassavae CFBP 4642]
MLSSPTGRQSATPLGEVQRWMLTATTHAAGLKEGLRSALAGQGLDLHTLVATPAGVDPHARLAIYANGYWLRLIECLQCDYPALSRLLGQELFAFFARAYLREHPSRSPTLHALGAGLPHFLRASQRSRPGQQRQRFPLELAWIERALSEASRARGLEDADVDTRMNAAVLAMGVPCVVRLPATTRLTVVSHTPESFRRWLSGERPNEFPIAGHTFLTVHRHRYRVGIEPLTDWQFFALRHAARRPRTLIECAQAAARRTGRTAGELHALLALWLPTAQASSLVELTSPSATTEPTDL